MDAGLLFRLAVILLLCLAVLPAFAATTALVYQSTDAGLARSLAYRLRDSGFEVEQAAHGDMAVGLSRRPALLVLPSGRSFPLSALTALEQYLENGGCLLAIGGPLFEDLLVHYDGRWMTRSAAQNEFAKMPPEKLLFELKPGDEKLWKRTTNHPEFEERLTVRDGALASFVSDISGWNTYMSAQLDQPFGYGRTVTVFEARGDRNTPRLTVEWRESDGSRWMADVKLSEKWTRFALAPSDFKYWMDNESKGRGGPGDCFNPDNAVQVSFGLAENNGLLPKGAHLFWIRGIGITTDKLAGMRSPLPVLDTLSPSYKVYPLAGACSLSARADQAVVDRSFAMQGRFSGVTPVWRPRGLGLPEGALAPARFIPCVDAYGDNGEWRGSVAWMLVHFEGRYAGGIWGAIGLETRRLPDKDRDRIADLAGAMAGRMFSQPFIRMAGSDAFALSSGDAPAAFGAGCAVVGARAAARNVRPSVSFVQEGKEVTLFAGEERPVASGAMEKWEKQGLSCTAQPGAARIVTRLFEGGRTVDTLLQPVVVLHPEASGERVTTGHGQFRLAGRPFYANGVNYWPRSRAGMEPGDLSGSWLGRLRYDPEVIERDLQMLEMLRINLVSIQYMDPDTAPQLVDFLDRCRNHRVLVNIFLDGGHPLTPDLPKVRQLIEAAGLARNPQVFAYDLAWEPRLGRRAQRASQDARWKDWIVEQYGSVERAEKDWGLAAPLTEGGQPASPSDEQLTRDGDWRRMVAAYRRFADDLISRGYGKVARFVRSLDANHLLGARTGFGGTGQAWPVPMMPFDLASGAAHLDFTSPEGYALAGDLYSYLAAGFTTEYGRFVSGGKPVFWAEFGLSIWPDTLSAQALGRQADHYRKCYEMFRRSHANGSAAWWWPGGFRVEEVSDYGLVRQDCEPRPAAMVMAAGARRAEGAIRLPAAAGYITIDRDRHVDGYAGVWEAAKEEYLVHLKAGRRVAIRTEGTGTTSADCPAVAVGGVPWTGDNPPKYLNAEICCLEACQGDEPWQAIEGGFVRARRGASLRLRAVITNTGEAKWLRKADGPGSVTLRLKMGETVVDAALPGDVVSLQTTGGVELEAPPLSGPASLELRMNCDGRGSFGQRIAIEVDVQD